MASPTIILASEAFDGVASTADFYTAEFDARNGAGARIDFHIAVTLNGVLGVTLQFLADYEGEEVIGWQDLLQQDVFAVIDNSATDPASSNNATCPKSDASLDAAETKGGVLITASELFQVLQISIPSAMAVRYRLVFEINSSSVGTVNRVVVNS